MSFYDETIGDEFNEEEYRRKKERQKAKLRELSALSVAKAV